MSENAATLDRPKNRTNAKTDRVPLSWKAKFGLIVFGIAVSLVLLELALRSVGFVYHFEKQHIPSAFADETFAILCVGDSCTFGQGARQPATQSYPAQLEHILQSRHGEDEFGVANTGQPGMNSSQLARRFEGYIKLHDPDLAIILIGNNDVWNQNETYAYLVGEGERASFSRKAKAWLRSWGDSLRVVRLARTISVNIRDKREIHWDGKKSARKTDDHWNAMEDTTPSDRKFEKGREIFGDIENVADLYRYNFEKMTEIAERHDVELLWLDYQMGARFGETKYIQPVLEEMGAENLDLFPYFHKEDVTKGVLRWDDSVRKEFICNDRWHPNEVGYAVMARAVYNKLVELGYAEGPEIEVLDNIQVHE